MNVIRRTTTGVEVMCMHLMVMALVHWHKLMVGDGVVRFTTTGDTAGVIDGSEGDCMECGV